MLRTIRFIALHSSALAAATLVLLVAGCQKSDLDNGQVYNDGTVKYTVAVGQLDDAGGPASKAELMTLADKSGNISIPVELEVTDGICRATTESGQQDATKGTLVNTAGSDKSLSDFAEAIGKKFEVRAYDGATEKFSQTVDWSDGGAWVATPVKYWPQAKNLTFLAYANLPGSQTATITSAGVSTTHTVPATAGEQKDILFGHYKGNGGNTGTAKIRFEHPLTAVQFKNGGIVDDLKVKSITLSGVAASGTATMYQTGAVGWSGVSPYDKTVSQSNDSGLPVDETSIIIGEPFIIIPQDLSEHNVKIVVAFKDDTVVEATINTGQWQEGKTNTYTLTKNGIISADIIQDYSGHVL